MEYLVSQKTKQQLEKIGVAVIYVFGSRIQGTAYPFSDLDVGIVFFDAKNAFENAWKTHQMIYSALSDDIPDSLMGPKLDIAFLQRANAALGIAAIKYGKIIFEADPVFRADFEENMFQRYIDYIPLQREYAEANIGAFLNT